MLFFGVLVKMGGASRVWNGVWKAMVPKLKHFMNPNYKRAGAKT